MLYSAFTIRTYTNDGFGSQCYSAPRGPLQLLVLLARLPLRRLHIPMRKWRYTSNQTKHRGSKYRSIVPTLPIPATTLNDNLRDLESTPRSPLSIGTQIGWWTLANHDKVVGSAQHDIAQVRQRIRCWLSLGVILLLSPWHGSVART